MSDGWVKVYRHIEQNPIWFAEPFTKAQAWIDIVIIASYKKSSFYVRGNEVVVQRGQFAYGELELAKRWKWSRNKVRRFLKWLETIHQIEQNKNRLLSVYTVINYSKYQSDDTTDDTTSDTTERQQKVQQKDIYKKEKKDKKDKNNTILHEDKPRVEAKEAQVPKTPEPAKRLPIEKQTYIHRIIYHFEDACQTNVTAWAMNAKHVYNMVRAGYTEDQIKRCITYMATKHPFYNNPDDPRGFDLATVSKEIVRLKAQERTTYGMDKAKGEDLPA